MKKVLIPILLLVFIFSVVDEASAQRRGKKKRRKKEDTEDTRSRRNSDEEEFEGVSFLEKLNPEIKLGNLQFFSSIFQASMKSNVGYKFNNTFSAGIGGKFDYFYRNNPGPINESFFSYGGLIYGRAKLGKQFYVQAEYNAFNTAFDLPRRTFYYPSAGIGYMYEGFDWSSGIELLVPFSEDARDFIGILEYWISFSKNF